MDRSPYPPNWEALSWWIRVERAGERCEGSPAYPDCRAEKRSPVKTGRTSSPRNGERRRGKAVTTAHLDHDPANDDPDNLRAWRQLTPSCTPSTPQRRGERTGYRRAS